MHTMGDASGFAPLPRVGRIFRADCKVRLSDTGSDRRARLDALARYLHDVAEDDASDAAMSPSVGWVLRKTIMTVARFPTLGERVRLDTFCSAVGSRWAERTTTITIDGLAAAQGVSVWVAIDVASGTPARLDGHFDEVYGPSAAGRRASARLALPPPPDDVRRRAHPWPLRSSDFDVWGHVNNAISWAAVEDAVDPARWMSLRAEVEHVAALEPGATVSVASQVADDGASVWLLGPGRGPAEGAVPGSVYTAATLVRLGAGRVASTEQDGRLRGGRSHRD